MSKKLERWKEAFLLSRGGRLNLISVVFDALPAYYMSLFRVPRVVAEAIEKIMRDFLWDEPNGEHHSERVAWDQICRPKERRGLGVSNICLRDRALLGKWW